jgi:plasmid stabilization system protein ParE
MTYSVQMSDSAGRDVDEILSYIAGNLSNPSAAGDFLDDFYKVLDALAENPLMYEASRDQRLADRGYRRFPVKNFVGLYLVDETARVVTIARVFYGGQNYAQYL